MEEFYSIFIPIMPIYYTHHVKVSKRANGSPEYRTRLDGLDPHGIGEEHAEDGNSLIVIGTSNRTGDVTRHNGDHCCSNKTCSSILKIN